MRRRAIARANPGGLGEAEKGDVKGPATMTLVEAMALAADRDRIAYAYVTGFDDVFSFALPRLYAARRAAANEGMAITALHMALLAAFPDSHIVRKYGPLSAEGVRAEAAAGARLEFWVDGALVCETGAPFACPWRVARGAHELVLASRSGASARIAFEVE